LLNVIEPYINHELNGADYFGTVTLKCNPKSITLMDIAKDPFNGNLEKYKIRRLDSIKCDVSSKEDLKQLMTSIGHFNKEPKKDAFVFEMLDLYLKNMVNVNINETTITINSYENGSDVVEKVVKIAKTHKIRIYY
jgi:hypothetical protein